MHAHQQIVDDLAFAMYLGKTWHDDLAQLESSKDKEWLGKHTRKMAVERSDFALLHWQWRMYDAFRKASFWDIEDDLTRLMEHAPEGAIGTFNLELEGVEHVVDRDARFTCLRGVHSATNATLYVHLRGKYDDLHSGDVVLVRRMKGYSVSLVEVSRP
jgi:hypothetical protein